MRKIKDKLTFGMHIFSNLTQLEFNQTSNWKYKITEFWNVGGLKTESSLMISLCRFRHWGYERLSDEFDHTQLVSSSATTPNNCLECFSPGQAFKALSTTYVMLSKMFRGHRWAQSQLSGNRTMTPIKKERFNSWKKPKYAVTSA